MTEIAPRRHSRAGLFTPFVLLLIVLAGWTVWWLYLAGQIDQRLDARAAALRQAGWTIAYVDEGVSGWPFRTRVEANNVMISAPSGHAVTAPQLAAEANAWNPSKWVLVATDGLTLDRAGKGKVGIDGRALRASVHGLTQRWPNIAVELAEPVFTPHSGAEAFPISRAGKVEFYLRPHLAPAGTPGADDSVDVLLRLIDAEGRAGGPVQGMAQNGKLTAQIEAVIEDADRLSGADDGGIFAAWSRAGGRFTEVRGEMSAGESRATLASAALSAGPDGRLEGRLALTAVKPLAAIVGLAGTRSGSVNRIGAAGAAAATAATAAAPGAGGDDVELTLVFRDGRTFLGPFALAPAPKLF